MIKLSELKGRDRIRGSLAQAMAGDRVPHALLIVGPSGTGKTTLAQALANGAMCMSPVQGDPCGHCVACKLIAGGMTPELTYIAPDEKGLIPVGAVRQAIDNMYIKPAYAAHRVCIIDDCDAMNAQAQNAFLKTLEEPPATGMLILTTSHPDLLLPTVISRISRFDIDRADEQETVDYIASNYPASYSRAHFIYMYTGGATGQIDQICTDPEFMELRDACMGHFVAMTTDAPDAAYSFAAWLEREQDCEEHILRMLMTLYSDMIMLSTGLISRVINTDFQARLTTLMENLQPDTCLRATKAIAEYRRRRKASVNHRMCCEALGLELVLVKSEE